MIKYCSISFKNPPRIISKQEAKYHPYALSFSIESDMGVFSVDMDKKGRIMMYGAVQIDPPEGFIKAGEYSMAWCFDPAIVATFAKLIEDNWNNVPGARWPDMGEEVPILPDDMVRETMLKYGIPTEPEAAAEFRAESEPLNENGEPPWL